MTLPADLHDLGGRHVFLTGGTGSVGRTLLDYLDRCQAARGGLRVTVLTRDAAAFAARYPVQAARPWLSLVEGSLAGLPALPRDTTDVIHAAADTHLSTGHARWIEQIVGGTQSLIEAALLGAVDRFLLVSSGAIYGPQPASLSHLREDYAGGPDPLRPGSTYGQAKRVAEQLCTVAHSEHGLATVVARLFAFGSAHIPLDGRYALGSFVRDAQAAAPGPIAVAGDGTAVRSYLNGQDMAHALVVALTAGDPGTAYNVGSDQAVTIAELAERVRDRLSPNRDVRILGKAGDGQRSRYVPDVTRIAALGAAARSDLDSVIDDVAGLAAPR
jgi:nucleoside-diphosphate-sugar epimerase